MHSHDLDAVLDQLQAQLPQSQTGGDAAPSISRTVLKAFVQASAHQFDEVEGPASALTPEEKKARWAKIFELVMKFLPIIIGAFAQTAPPTGPMPPEGAQ